MVCAGTFVLPEVSKHLGAVTEGTTLFSLEPPGHVFLPLCPAGMDGCAAAQFEQKPDAGENWAEWPQDHYAVVSTNGAWEYGIQSERREVSPQVGLLGI